MRYGPADADSSHSRLEALQIGPQRPTPDTSELFSMNVNPLTDPDALRSLLGEAPAAEEAAPVVATYVIRPIFYDRPELVTYLE